MKNDIWMLKIRYIYESYLAEMDEAKVANFASSVYIGGDKILVY